MPNTSACTCDGSNLDLQLSCDVSFEDPGTGATTTCFGTTYCTASGWVHVNFPMRSAITWMTTAMEPQTRPSRMTWVNMPLTACCWPMQRQLQHVDVRKRFRFLFDGRGGLNVYWNAMQGSRM